MKKNILSLAVASSVAGLAVSAQAAMYVNPEGTGEVLLFPYYNAQNGYFRRRLSFVKIFYD